MPAPLRRPMPDAGPDTGHYRIPDGSTFATRHERELGVSDPGSGVVVFSATRDHIWYWEHRHELPRGEGERMRLSEVLELFDRTNWGWAVDTHLQALRAAFAECELVEATLGETDDGEPPTLELVATMLTLYGRFEILADE